MTKGAHSAKMIRRHPVDEDAYAKSLGPRPKPYDLYDEVDWNAEARMAAGQPPIRLVAEVTHLSPDAYEAQRQSDIVALDMVDKLSSAEVARHRISLALVAVPVMVIVAFLARLAGENRPVAFTFALISGACLVAGELLSRR